MSSRLDFIITQLDFAAAQIEFVRTQIETESVRIDCAMAQFAVAAWGYGKRQRACN